MKPDFKNSFRIMGGSNSTNMSNDFALYGFQNDGNLYLNEGRISINGWYYRSSLNNEKELNHWVNVREYWIFLK